MIGKEVPGDHSISIVCLLLDLVCSCAWKTALQYIGQGRGRWHSSLFVDRGLRFPKCSVSSSSTTHYQDKTRNVWHQISTFILFWLSWFCIVSSTQMRGLTPTPQNTTPRSIKIVEEHYIDGSHMPRARRQVSPTWCELLCFVLLFSTTNWSPSSAAPEGNKPHHILAWFALSPLLSTM